MDVGVLTLKVHISPSFERKCFDNFANSPFISSHVVFFQKIHIVNQVCFCWLMPFLMKVLCQQLVLLPPFPEGIQGVLSFSPQMWERCFIFLYIWIWHLVHFSANNEFSWVYWCQIIRGIRYHTQWTIVNDSLNFSQNYWELLDCQFRISNYDSQGFLKASYIAFSKAIGPRGFFHVKDFSYVLFSNNCPDYFLDLSSNLAQAKVLP